MWQIKVYFKGKSKRVPVLIKHMKWTRYINYCIFTTPYEKGFNLLYSVIHYDYNTNNILNKHKKCEAEKHYWKNANLD